MYGCCDCATCRGMLKLGLLVSAHGSCVWRSTQSQASNGRQLKLLYVDQKHMGRLTAQQLTQGLHEPCNCELCQAAR